MRKYILVILAALGIVLGCTLPSQAQIKNSDDVKKHVYLIVVDKLSVNDLNDASTPNISKLIKQGAIGLISSRTLRSQNSTDASLTIGAGNLARGYTNGIMGYNANEKVTDHNQVAAQLYYNLTGYDPGTNASMLVNLPEIIVGLRDENVTTQPGAMGEALRRGGFQVCVLGNGDTRNTEYRNALAIGMDDRGLVPLGDVGPNTYINSPLSFVTCETNYQYLGDQLLKYRDQADVMIVDLADLARLEDSDIAMDDVAEREKQARLAKIDDFIAQIKRTMNTEKDLLLIVSPSPAQNQIANKDKFTPIIAYGSSIEAGMLTSGATKRDYVVSNTDIAPTVLEFFGLKVDNHSMIGQAILSKSADTNKTLYEAQDLSLRSSTVNRLRVSLIKGYVVLQIFVIIVSILAIFLAKKRYYILEQLILSLIAIPLVLLPLGQLHLPNDATYILITLAATVVLTGIVWKICRKTGADAFVVFAILTALALNIDILTGANMIKSSVLGYDPMAGARYYGIGNEYMGILIGSMIIIAAAVYERFKRREVLYAIGLIFMVQCFAIAGPSLGANSDGLVTAPVAFFITLALLYEVRIRPGILLTFGAGLLLVILGVVYFDMHQAPELQSHIGRAASQIMANGWQDGLTIIQRKLGMNLKLIRYTIWSWVFMVTLLVLGLLVYRPLGAMERLKKEHPYMVKGFIGIIIGAVVGLIINDSGIVAAATTSIYLVVPLLLLIMQQENPDSPGSGQ